MFEKTDRVIIVGKATDPWLTVGKELVRIEYSVVYRSRYTRLFIIIL